MGYPGTYTYVINGIFLPFSRSDETQALTCTKLTLSDVAISPHAAEFTAASLLRSTHAPNFLQSDAALRCLLNVLEADLRLELLRLGRLLDDAVELIDLFKSEPFGLVDHEPDEGDADEAERAPDLRLKSACEQCR